jgi:hypothetical protein
MGSYHRPLRAPGSWRNRQCWSWWLVVRVAVMCCGQREVAARGHAGSPPWRFPLTQPSRRLSFFSSSTVIYPIPADTCPITVLILFTAILVPAGAFFLVAAAWPAQPKTRIQITAAAPRRLFTNIYEGARPTMRLMCSQWRPLGCHQIASEKHNVAKTT